MGKRLASIILALLFLVLAREAVLSVRPFDKASEEQTGTAKQGKSTGAVVPEKEISFYPPVPVTLPDLNRGYLFNAERFLDDGKEETGAEGGGDEKHGGPSIDLEKAYYAGSLIYGDTRKALLVYPDSEGTSGAAVAGKSAGKKTGTQKPRHYLTLAANDMVSGYTVVAIEAERLVLQKGAEKVEKPLYDQKKARIAPPPPPPKPTTPKTTSSKQLVQQKRTTQTARTPSSTSRSSRVSGRTTSRPVTPSQAVTNNPFVVPGTRRSQPSRLLKQP